MRYKGEVLKDLKEAKALNPQKAAEKIVRDALVEAIEPQAGKVFDIPGGAEVKSPILSFTVKVKAN
jgi:hypothetical protein